MSGEFVVVVIIVSHIVVVIAGHIVVVIVAVQCTVCRPRSHSVKLVAIICVDVGECWLMCSLIYCPAFCSQLSHRGETLLRAAVSVHVQQRPCLLRHCPLETEHGKLKLFHAFWRNALFSLACLTRSETRDHPSWVTIHYA